MTAELRYFEFTVNTNGYLTTLNLFRGAIGDGMIVMFVLGLATWYTGTWENIAVSAKSDAFASE